MSIQPVHSAQAYGSTKKTAKTVAKATVATAAVAATLALGAKNGKFKVNDKTNKIIARVLPYLDRAGNFINNKVGVVADRIAQTGIKEKITNSKVFTSIKETAGKVEEYLRTNIGKFNPDKASAADKAAETFNNFVK